VTSPPGRNPKWHAPVALSATLARLFRAGSARVDYGTRIVLDKLRSGSVVRISFVGGGKQHPGIDDEHFSF